MRLTTDAVYTILHPKKLADMAAARRPAELRATKRWVTAKRLFDEAHEAGLEMIVLYADAADDCSNLIYWGRLTQLEVDATGTSYTVAHVVPLEGHRTQELVLCSTQQRIAEGYLRPYAMVRTPSFIPQPSGGAPMARQPPHPSKDASTTLFSFGYWGAGGATRALVDAVNEAEKLRGFEPPLWADIRISRSVRAAGFRDGAFEKLLGAQYVHMPDLGNRAVLDGGSLINIKRPAAAEDLLERALSRPRRRVIFFCACKLPGKCHRHVVAELVTKAARRRGIGVKVIEWPGGQPSAVSFEVSPAVLRAVTRESQKTLALPHAMSRGAAASLPWGTGAVLTAGTDRVSVLLGPAHFTARGAHLKVLAVQPGVNDAAAFRKNNGYVGMTSNA